MTSEQNLNQLRYLDRITFNPNQCGGRPCLRGMRIRVSDVLEMLAAQIPADEILRDFPDLEPEDIQACREYAATHPESFSISLAAIKEEDGKIQPPLIELYATIRNGKLFFLEPAPLPVRDNEFYFNGQRIIINLVPESAVSD